MPKITIVNEKDEVIDYRERYLPHKPGEYTRVAALWITNSKGEILLAQRAFVKKTSPGKWATAVAGTVDEGETYQENIQKEAFEELGLIDVSMTIGPKCALTYAADHAILGQWFFATLDIDVSELLLQKDEVNAVRWVTPDELRTWHQEHPEDFSASMDYCLEHFVPQNN